MTTWYFSRKASNAKVAPAMLPDWVSPSPLSSYCGEVEGAMFPRNLGTNYIDRRNGCVVQWKQHRSADRNGA